MLRPYLLLAALSLAAPAWSQPSTGIPAMDADGSAASCRIRMNATPSSWIIEAHDPFGGAAPEGTFGVTFVNEDTETCSFAPMFALDQPPFGLSRGTGSPIQYALLNLTDSQDATPRAGRSQRQLTQRDVVLAPQETRTILYKLLVDADGVKGAGMFTQDVTLEAQDSRFRTLGATRLVLGINVLPSARIGLAGAYTIDNGLAVVDLGELREGHAPVPLQLRVNSTGRYDISVSSANAGRLRLGSTGWYVPYSLALGGNSVNLAGPDTLTGPTGTGFQRNAMPIQFMIGDVSDRRAGLYSDVISIAVTAQ